MAVNYASSVTQLIDERFYKQSGELHNYRRTRSVYPVYQDNLRAWMLFQFVPAIPILAGLVYLAWKVLL